MIKTPVDRQKLQSNSKAINTGRSLEGTALEAQ